MCEGIYHFLTGKILYTDFVYRDPKTFSYNKKVDAFKQLSKKLLRANSYASFDIFKAEYDNFNIHSGIA